MGIPYCQVQRMHYMEKETRVPNIHQFLTQSPPFWPFQTREALVDKWCCLKNKETGRGACLRVWRVEIGAITRTIQRTPTDATRTFLIIVHDSTRHICSNPHRKLKELLIEYWLFILGKLELILLPVISKFADFFFLAPKVCVCKRNELAKEK